MTRPRLPPSRAGAGPDGRYRLVIRLARFGRAAKAGGAAGRSSPLRTSGLLSRIIAAGGCSGSCRGPPGQYQGRARRSRSPRAPAGQRRPRRRCRRHRRRRRPGPASGRGKPAGDEVKRRPALHLDRVVRVVGEDKDGSVVRRLLAPPAAPIAVPLIPDRTEHVAAHDIRGGAGHLVARRDIRFMPRLAGMPMPLMERKPASTDRVLQALVRPRDEPIDGDQRSVKPMSICPGSNPGPATQKPRSAPVFTRGLTHVLDRSATPLPTAPRRTRPASRVWRESGRRRDARVLGGCPRLTSRRGVLLGSSRR